LDTSGYTTWEIVEEVLRYTSLVLYDIKHMDPKCHREGTGVDNALILDNARKMKGKATIWIRVPIIPGYNDSPEHIRRVAELSLEIGAEKLSLLPYHEFGRTKYKQLGREYPCRNIHPPSDEHMQQLKEIVEQCGMSASIGR